MVQATSRAGLSLEPGHCRGIAGQLWPEDLDGHRSVQGELSALVHLTDSTATDGLDDLVAVRELLHIYDGTPDRGDG